MRTIGIADFKKLVMERLVNPRDYAGRSLVLWNADYMDYGIAYRVIEQCCERYNEENPNDQVWFRQSDMCFTDEDYTKLETIRTWYVREKIPKNIIWKQRCADVEFSLIQDAICFMNKRNG